MKALSSMLVPALIMCLGACAGPPIPHEPDIIDAMLSAPVDQVRSAVVQVLTDGGYDVEQRDEPHLTTGYREDIRGPWDWLLHCCFGTGRSRVDALVTEATDASTRLRLNVLYEGKDGLFTRWEESPTALPQSAENQLRLVKNRLKML